MRAKARMRVDWTELTIYIPFIHKDGEKKREYKW